MSFHLTSLTVENFRSVRGNVSVSLDAPIVLIHGSNGVGKTSLLTAIEIGLTGAAATLDGGGGGGRYAEHLLHKDASKGSGRIVLSAEGPSSALHSDISITKSGLNGKGILSPSQAHFYSERCYLAQSTLARLLEIYQHQDARRSDSPLTRFVKELLGIEPLDNLIEGLHTAGNVTRLRSVAPQFWAAREEIPTLLQKVKATEALVSQIHTNLETLEVKLRQLAVGVMSSGESVDPEILLRRLDTAIRDEESILQNLANRRRELLGAQQQILQSAGTAAAEERRTMEATHAHTHDALANWSDNGGSHLIAVTESVQALFPDVPAASNNAIVAHTAAQAAVLAELGRLLQILASDKTDNDSLKAVDASIKQGRARIEALEAQLVELTGTNRSLAQALATIAPHIHDENCPVCGRDYTEISAGPLAAHVSEQVAHLVEAAGRLESLARDRQATATVVAAAQRESETLTSRVLPQARLDELKTKVATLQELATALQLFASVAEKGGRLQVDVALASRRLAELNSRESSIPGIRSLVAQFAVDLSFPAIEVDTPLDAVVASMLMALSQREAEIVARQSDHRAARDALSECQVIRRSHDAAVSDMNLVRKRLDFLNRAKTEADRRIEIAKTLANDARVVRTNFVRKVFNDQLNAMWKDLFIRLAPDEDFVPAFSLPGSPTGPVEAILETHHRSGANGGDPRMMLSAGNLNTAALTLFLALHLSVTPTLPLIVIDDPVQSMDEVHIAQFAALLRTLKGTQRQVIIAVHERALFEYLSLELSPAFNGDRLITIEVGREPDGQTTAPWVPHTYKIETELAA